MRGIVFFQKKKKDDWYLYPRQRTTWIATVAGLSAKGKTKRMAYNALRSQVDVAHLHDIQVIDQDSDFFKR